MWIFFTTTALTPRHPWKRPWERWIILCAAARRCIVFSPLDQGVLTNRYLKGVPSDSRAGKPDTDLSREDITENKLSQVRRLNEIAHTRGQSMAQMALAWVLRTPAVTSALVGASR